MKVRGQVMPNEVYAHASGREKRNSPFGPWGVGQCLDDFPMCKKMNQVAAR